MLNSKEQMTESLFPLFRNILRRINPAYRSVEITGDSKTRYLTYRCPNKSYISTEIETEDCMTLVCLFLFVTFISALFFKIPNVFWSNFCFYVIQIISMIIVYNRGITVKESIVFVTIVLVIMLLYIEILYWITYDSEDIAHKNISILWPDIFFKFVFK